MKSLTCCSVEQKGKANKQSRKRSASLDLGGILNGINETEEPSNDAVESPRKKYKKLKQVKHNIEENGKLHNGK